MTLISDTFAHMNTATKVTLIAGYALALPGFLAIVPALRNPEGRTRLFTIPNRVVIALELFGSGCVTTAWFVEGYRLNNSLNVAWVIACSTFWLRAENKLRLRKQEA